MSPGSDSSHVNVLQPRRSLQIFPSHGEELFPSLRLLSNCWEADVLLGRALFTAEGWSRRSAAGSEPACVLGQRRARCCWPGGAGRAVAAAVSAGAIVPRWCSAQRGRGSRDNASPVWVEACGYSGAVTGAELSDASGLHRGVLAPAVLQPLRCGFDVSQRFTEEENFPNDSGGVQPEKMKRGGGLPCPFLIGRAPASR